MREPESPLLLKLAPLIAIWLVKVTKNVFVVPLQVSAYFTKTFKFMAKTVEQVSPVASPLFATARLTAAVARVADGGAGCPAPFRSKIAPLVSTVPAMIFAIP